MLRSIVKSMIYRVGLFAAWHGVRNRDALTIVSFHRVLKPAEIEPMSAGAEWIVSVELFRQCLSFFRRHYNVVRLSDIWANHHEGQALPPNPLVITFDDGWTDNRTIAMPVLQEFRLPATFFVNTDMIDTDTGQYLSAAQLCDLHQHGFEIGIHGTDHRAYTELTDNELTGRLDHAKQKLETWIGASNALHLSFPHGDYDRRVVDRVQERGYGLMLTSDPIINVFGTNRRYANLLGRLTIHAHEVADANGDLEPAKLAGWLFVRQRAALSV